MSFCFIFLTQLKKLKFFSTREIKPIEKLISDPDLLYGSFSLHSDKIKKLEIIGLNLKKKYIKNNQVLEKKEKK